MLTHTYTRIHTRTRKFDFLQTRLMYSTKQKSPFFLGLSPIEGLGLVYDVRVLHTHTHTHTLTYTHSLTHSLTHPPPLCACVRARARASVCVCHCVRLLVPPTVREDPAPLGRTVQQARGCQGAVGEQGPSQCARRSESAPQHICVHVL